MKWSDVSYILRSPLAKKVLEALENENLIPSQIEKRSGVNLSHVSNKLVELLDRKMVECLNPEDRKFRFYKITMHGKHVLQEARTFKE